MSAPEWRLIDVRKEFWLMQGRSCGDAAGSIGPCLGALPIGAARRGRPLEGPVDHGCLARARACSTGAPRGGSSVSRVVRRERRSAGRRSTGEVDHLRNSWAHSPLGASDIMASAVPALAKAFEVVRYLCPFSPSGPWPDSPVGIAPLRPVARSGQLVVHPIEVGLQTPVRRVYSTIATSSIRAGSCAAL